jgi:hypothetical protein
VVVFNVVTGSSGRERIYDGYPDVDLELVRARTFDGRLQLLALSSMGLPTPTPTVPRRESESRATRAY